MNNINTASWSARTDRRLIRATGGSERFVLVELTAPSVRRLLLTDGLANQGITDPGELAQHARALRARGVATSTIGVGNDFDEAVLQAMADAGGGHFYFAGSMPEILDHLTSEVGEALDVTVREAILDVTAPKGVSVRALTPHPTEERGARTTIRLGDLVADQAVRVVLRLRMPAGELGAELGVLLAVSDADGVMAGVDGFGPDGVSWQSTSDAVSNAQPRDGAVDRTVAELFAARARQEAVRLNLLGEWDAAQRALRSVADKISHYAGADPDLLALVERLRQVEAPQMAAPMQEASRKQAYFASSNLARSKNAYGKSLKRPGA